MLVVCLYIITGILVFGTLSTVKSVGKPRKPLTGGTAAMVVLINGVFITVFIVAALRLS